MLGTGPRGPQGAPLDGAERVGAVGLPALDSKGLRDQLEKANGNQYTTNSLIPCLALRPGQSPGRGFFSLQAVQQQLARGWPLLPPRRS